MGKKYCTNCGAELPAVARFCANCGNSINDDVSLELEQNSIYTSKPKDEVTRLVIKEMGTDGISGLNKDELTEKLLYFYDNSIARTERINTLIDAFDIDYETADKIDWVSSTKIPLFTSYFNNKSDGATKFDIKGKNGMLKTDLPISEYMNNVGFIIENNAEPIFKTDKTDISLPSGDNQLVTYSTVNYVDLYETRAVRQSRGSSYGRKGYRTHSSTSTSKQQWQKLGRGKITLQGDKCIYIGGGQRRIIDRKKILDIVYYNNSSGFEVTVSNRQKTMKFLLPGRDIDDGKRLANAIKNGKTTVALKELTKDPGNCYIATYVYGDYDASEVLTLRKFRDEKLLNNFIGKGFVKFYYSTSPFLIEHFGGKIFRNTSKKVLDYIVKILN